MNKLYFALLVALSHCGIGANFDADALFQAFQQEVADGVQKMTAKIAAMDHQNQMKRDPMGEVAQGYYDVIVLLKSEIEELEEDENDQQLKLRQSLNSRYAFLRRKLGVLLRQHPRLRKDYSITT